ncbi:MAG: hypothetical protein AB7H93_12165 [Vicinamibacterales bacterium]
MVLPIRPGGKVCGITGWNSPSFQPLVIGPGDNMAWRLDGLADVDADCPEARAAAPKFVPRTECQHGRPSGGVSHWLFECPDARPETFHDVVKDDSGAFPVLVELRAGAGQYTVIPPSRLPVTKGSTTLEALVAYRSGEPTPCAYPVVRAATVNTAITALLARHMAPDGHRWEFHEAAAGFLLGLGIDDTTARLILETAAEIVGDRDTQPRPAVWVKRTVDRIAKGEPCSGGPKLAELIGSHGDAVVARIRDWCGRGAEEGIVVEGGRVSEIVDRVEAALLAAGGLYQRGGMLARAVKLDARSTEADVVRREAGSTVLVVPKEAYLSERMGQVLPWYRRTKDGDLTRIDPPALYARTSLARGEWPFPTIRAVVGAPTLARDGRLIDRPGFDTASGLLLDVTPGQFPPIPSRPSRDDAHEALTMLLRPLRGFPFDNDASLAVALAALLTALVRPSLSTSPLHGFDAPTAGTGKSLLAEAVGLLATGVRPPALSQGKSDEEDEKRLSTVLFAGDSVIHIDNCERPLHGDFLCSMLTQPVVQARVLGLSERRVMPSVSLVLASGNNLSFSGDVSRRAVVCRLDAGVERPDARPFDFDVHAEIMANRPALVVAGLTVLRAYAIAGHPERLTPMGSFNDWGWIRGALVWTGCADPADTRAAILDNDPKRDELVSVLDAWAAAFGDRPVEVADIARRADAAMDERHVESPVVALREALIGAACRGGVWNAKSVGWWLRRHRDRVVAGRCLRSDQGHDRQTWTLVQSGTQGRLTL